MSGKKNVLVIGGGGREHAVVWKLASSERVAKIYALPGNGGIASIAECIEGIKPTDVDGVCDFVKSHKDIDFVVVTPDDPLALGLVDALAAIGIPAFGPTKAAAIIEASKAYSKDFMKKYGIPTAAYEIFDSYEKASDYLASCAYPTVIKADGLALGKGAVICENQESAQKTLKEMMLEKAFGSAGERVVIEEFLTGYEVSLLSFTDGETIYPAIPARDYKRAQDDNKGLNTGGMGCFCPVPEFDEKLQKRAYDEIMLPTIRALKKEGRRFKGVLYFGLMVTTNGDIRVIEYNARFGDPETQVILPMLKTDLFDIFEAVVQERLAELKISWHDGACVCVIAASGGYPIAYEKGKKITFGAKDEGAANAKAPQEELGSETLEAQDELIFHAGTKQTADGYLTNGGRVLAVSARGKTHLEARQKAYKAIEKISFEKMFYRKDIAKNIGD